MEAWGAAIATALAIIAGALKWWQNGKPARNQEKRNAEIQKGRTDIANGNAAAVSARLDSLLAPGPGSAPRLGDDQDTARRLAAITGDAGVGSQR